jgi:hypothetical protein
MINQKPDLRDLLESAEGKKLLFLGKEGIFTAKEIERFLKPYHITITQDLDEDVAGVVEHHRLNPVEEDISNDAYDRKLPLYKLSEFEELMSNQIDDDALLMAIKLGNDQERLIRLLGNEHLSDALFVRLLKLYRFNEEEEDNRQDRDVIMYTLRRYIEIKPNEEDLLYSYLTLRRLATEAEDPHLLEALMQFPDFAFLIRGKEKVTLKETIARNPVITDAIIRKLLALRSRKIDVALAGNPSVPTDILRHLITQNDLDIHMALATNPGIDDPIFGALLEKDEQVVSLLFLRQKIDKERLAQVEAASLEPALFAVMGANEQLESDIVTALLEKEEPLLLERLAGNHAITSDILEEIYQRDEEHFFSPLAQNPSTPLWILETLYDEERDNEALCVALAHNPSTPEKILRELFAREHFEINRGLATNASLPLELLDTLKLDTRLQNELAQNERLASSYEEVLNRAKVVMNI